MKEVPRVEWATRLLADQVERLAELRNASPRDAGFKLWRQTTLTVIQRIWPGDLARSERFRRVPFSPAAPRATRAQAKEHYERGCAEAASYIRNLISEIETRGIVPPDPAAAPARPASLPPELAGTPRQEPGEIQRAFDPSDLFEPSPLQEAPPDEPVPQETAPEAPAPHSVAQPPAAPESREPRPNPPARPGALRQPPVAPSAAVPQRPVRSRTVSPAPGTPAASTRPPAPPSRPASARPSVPAASAPPPAAANPAAPAEPPGWKPEPPLPRAPRRSDRRALKEMLGFLDESSLVAHPPASESRPAEPDPVEAELEPAPPPPAFGASEDAYEPEPPEESPYGEISSAPGRDYEDAFGSEEIGGDPSEEADYEVAEEEGYVEDEGEAEDPLEEEEEPEILLPDFLARATSSREAPQSQAAAPRPSVAPSPPELEPRPATAPRVVTPQPAEAVEPPPRTPAATALMTLAGEVARLGVPEGQRAAARAALLDLARQLDEETATWDSIREFLWMVADYPRLAQRAIPLLVPYLDVV